MATSYLPMSYGWVNYEFGSTCDLDPATGVCLVLRQTSGSEGARVRYHENGFSMPQNSHWTITGNAGSSWSTPVNNRDMLLYVYGTIVTEGSPQWP